MAPCRGRGPFHVLPLFYRLTGRDKYATMALHQAGIELRSEMPALPAEYANREPGVSPGQSPLLCLTTEIRKPIELLRQLEKGDLPRCLPQRRHQSGDLPQLDCDRITPLGEKGWSRASRCRAAFLRVLFRQLPDDEGALPKVSGECPGRKTLRISRKVPARDAPQRRRRTFSHVKPRTGLPLRKGIFLWRQHRTDRLRSVLKNNR